MISITLTGPSGVPHPERNVGAWERQGAALLRHSLAVLVDAQGPEALEIRKQKKVRLEAGSTRTRALEPVIASRVE